MKHDVHVAVRISIRKLDIRIICTNFFTLQTLVSNVAIIVIGHPDPSRAVMVISKHYQFYFLNYV